MKRRNIETFGAAVEYLYDVPRFTNKNTMEDTRAHLVRLGHPDRSLKNVIHVAGTNGKGSVCAYLRSMLQEKGFRVAVFTSPHLVDIRERFMVDGQLISKEDFLRIFRMVYDSLDWERLEQGEEGEGYHPTFFEYLFFMAVLYFREKQPDYCILETGLGGRLDATNTVSEKSLCMITRIGLDHVEYLGNTLGEIAGEKAGIMRPGVPCVFLEDGKEAAAVFVEHGKRMGIPLHPVSNRDYVFRSFQNKSIDFSVYTGYYGYVEVALRTIARYQMENATLAVRAMEILFDKNHLTAEEIRNGLQKAFWPGRMEEVLPEVFVDGAHNEDGIRAFLETVRGDGLERSQRVLLFSVVQDKDYRSMIQQICSADLFDRIAVAHMETKRAAEMDGLRRLWQEEKSSETTLDFYAHVGTACEELLRSEKKRRIYIAGSLYLVGEIKEFVDNDQF